MKATVKPTNLNHWNPHCLRTFPLRTRIRHSLGFRTLTTCGLSRKGHNYPPEGITVGKPIGKGSFGEVFVGVLNEGGEGRQVVLKRVRPLVSGAQEMAEMEHLLNVYTSRMARKSVADFVGYCEVTSQSGRTQSKLTPGLWLIWEWQGDKTLAYYLRRRDCLEVLAKDMDIDIDLVVPTVISQILECINNLHSIGIIHRDIKPSNIIFCERDHRFKLIDLGAAADLRGGTNFDPNRTILDPEYCPPEEYVLPTNAPDLAETAMPVRLAMSPLLWQKHRPDCFDTWSVGIILLQLALPFLRQTTALRNFRGTFTRCGYDLEEWRIRSALPARTSVLLDANDELGWDLAIGLLRPREIVKMSDEVHFKSQGAPRLTASEALKHPYIRQATSTGVGGLFSSLLGGLGSQNRMGDNEEVGIDEGGDEMEVETSNIFSSLWGAVSGSGSGSGSGTGSVGKKTGKVAWWENIKSRVYDLETRINKQMNETKTQTAAVVKLEAEVAAGRASQKELKEAKSTLRTLQSGLQSSVAELDSVYARAKGFLGSLLQSTGKAAGEGSPAALEQRQSAIAAKEEEEGKEEEEEDKEVEQKGPNKVAEMATNTLYQSLKFTGKAIESLADYAATKKAEMDEKRRLAEEESTARKAAQIALVNTLTTLEPPLSFTTSWEDVKDTVVERAKRDGFGALSEKLQKDVVETYVAALQKAKIEQRRRAASDFHSLLVEVGDNIMANSFEEFADAFRDDVRFGKVPEAEARLAFEAHVAQFKAAKVAKDQAAKSAQQAEAAFKALMMEYEPIVAQSIGNWAKAKRALWADPRYSALSESRRLALFEEYGSILVEAGVPQVKNDDDDDEEEAELDYLIREQERLKEEYDKMSQKLNEVERQLQVNALLSGVQRENDGSVTFQFGEDLIPQAPTKKKIPKQRRQKNVLK